MKTVIEMAREAAGDDWGLFQEFMPEIHRLAELVRADERARMAEQPTTTENNGGKTGWPPGLLQDDCKGLSKWLSNRPDAKRRVREALAEQPAQQEPVAIIASLMPAERHTLLEEGHSLHDSLYTTPPAQQEPFAWADLNALTAQFNSVNCGTAYRLPAEGRQPLYTSPPPCQTCEALARTVMLDQTSHDTTPPQRKPLSNEKIGQAARDAHIAFCLNKHQTYEHALTRAIEAAHGIKENT